MANKAIIKRIETGRGAILKQLEKTPIVQLACRNAGVGRATYYRWRKKDDQFTQKADESIRKGRLFINDMAESKLLNAIQEQNMTGIIFWLKHNHPVYTTRVEITQKTDEDKDKLKPEEEARVKKALALAGLIEKEVKKKKNEKTQS